MIATSFVVPSKEHYSSLSPWSYFFLVHAIWSGDGEARGSDTLQLPFKPFAAIMLHNSADVDHYSKATDFIAAFTAGLFSAFESQACHGVRWVIRLVINTVFHLQIGPLVQIFDIGARVESNPGVHSSCVTL